MKIRKLKQKIQQIKDPRRQYGYLLHNLETILGIAFCAILCGVDDYTGMEIFGHRRYKWLSKHFNLKYGIPDELTFERMFARLDPAQVCECLNCLRGEPDCKGKILNIDGKTIRGGAEACACAPHVVSAWVGEDHMTLEQVTTEEKSNEITAIPKLLDLVDVQGATVTIDAMGCQK